MSLVDRIHALIHGEPAGAVVVTIPTEIYHPPKTFWMPKTWAVDAGGLVYDSIVIPEGTWKLDFAELSMDGSTFLFGLMYLFLMRGTQRIDLLPEPYVIQNAPYAYVNCYPGLTVDSESGDALYFAVTWASPGNTGVCKILLTEEVKIP